jgi:hypothetical protein
MLRLLSHVAAGECVIGVIDIKRPTHQPTRTKTKKKGPIRRRLLKTGDPIRNQKARYVGLVGLGTEDVRSDDIYEVEGGLKVEADARGA